MMLDFFLTFLQNCLHGPKNCHAGCDGQVSMHMDVVDKLLSFIRYGSPFCILYIQAGKNEYTCPPMHVVDKFGNVIGDLFANTSQQRTESLHHELRQFLKLIWLVHSTLFLTTHHSVRSARECHK